MGIKDFMYTEKGKITGGILAAVLITTAIMVPVSIFADRALRGDKSPFTPVESFGYDDQVSSTGKKVNGYMRVDQQYTSNIWGGSDVLSGEPTLLANEHYNSVSDDIFILDGVAGSKEALGYLSSSWVGGYEEVNMNALKIFHVDPNGNPADGKDDRADKANYLDPKNKDDQKLWVRQNSNTGHEKEMAATLNAHLKVPMAVADTLRDAGLIGGTLTYKEISSPSSDAKVYFDWLKNRGYADDLLVSIAFFDFMAYDSENITNINNNVMPGTNPEGTVDFLGTPGNLTALDDAYKAIMGSETASLKSAVQNQYKSNSGTYSMKVDGTGTNSGVMKMEIINFSNSYFKNVQELGPKDSIFTYDLINGGSGEGWRVPTDDTVPGTVDPGTPTDGRADAFIGTQSRFSKNSELAGFGYGDDSSATFDDDGVLKYLDPSSAPANSPLGYTMGIDLPVFFTREDTTINYTINTQRGLEAIGGEDTGKKVGDSVNVKIDGISDMGAKQIYQFGTSWQEVLDQGLAIAKLA